MKKEFKVVAVVLVALIVFLCGFGIGTTNGIGKSLQTVAENGIKVEVKGNAAAGQVAATQAPVAVAPTAAPTPAPAPSGDATTAAPAGDATTAAPSGGSSAGVPSTKEEIVAKYNEVINAGKHLQDGSIHKVSNTSIEVTDLPVASLKGTVNSIVEGLVKPSDETYTYTAGKDPNGGEAIGLIAPGGRDVALKPEGVANATATPDGAGYKMTITLASEKSTYDGTNTVNPVHHESCLSPLNLATIELPMNAKITAADMTYPGATLEVTVDGQGRVTYYKTTLPLEGSGTGKLGIPVTLGLKGEMVETFEFTY